MPRLAASPRAQASSDASTPHCPPLRHHVDVERGIIFVDLLELRDADAVIAALLAVTRDPAFCPELHFYIDCSYLRSVPPAHRVHDFARQCLATPRPAVSGRTAIVAIHPLAHDAARFFALLTGAPRERFRVFASWTEARLWLDPTEPPGSPAAQRRWVRRADAIHDLAQRARLLSA